MDMYRNEFFITDESIAEYVSYLKNEEKAPATIEKYVRDIRGFMDFLNGADVTKQAALKWKDEISKARTAVTVNAMLVGINGFFEFFELGFKVKPLKIQSQIFSQTDRELTREEYERLLDAAISQGNERLSLIMQTICSTGIRVSELKFITVESVKKGFAEVQNKGKIRTILIPEKLSKALLLYAKKRGITVGYVFVSKNDNPLNRSNIWADMKKLSEAAGVNAAKIFPHNLRKVFAKAFHAEDSDIVKLSDILGHSDCKTTRIYIRETGSGHRKIINSLGLVRSISSA